MARKNVAELKKRLIANPLARASNPRLDDDDVLNELVLVAVNDGDAYRDSMNAKRAVENAMRDYKKRMSQEMEETFDLVRDRAVGEVRRQWRATLRSRNPQSKDDYMAFIINTLVPDLEESGRDATAEDFIVLVEFLEDPELDELWSPSKQFWEVEKFVQYLEKTLIPDLKASGHEFTAEDFEIGVRFLREDRKM